MFRGDVCDVCSSCGESIGFSGRLLTAADGEVVCRYCSWLGSTRGERAPVEYDNACRGETIRSWQTKVRIRNLEREVRLLEARVEKARQRQHQEGFHSELYRAKSVTEYLGRLQRGIKKNKQEAADLKKQYVFERTYA